jgi:hypothetical protein
LPVGNGAEDVRPFSDVGAELVDGDVGTDTLSSLAVVVSIVDDGPVPGAVL